MANERPENWTALLPPDFALAQVGEENLAFAGRRAKWMCAHSPSPPLDWLRDDVTRQVHWGCDWLTEGLGGANGESCR